MSVIGGYSEALWLISSLATNEREEYLRPLRNLRLKPAWNSVSSACSVGSHGIPDRIGVDWRSYAVQTSSLFHRMDRIEHIEAGRVVFFNH